MLKGKSHKILSLVLILSLMICGVCHADNVFVAGAPTNSAYSNNGLAGSSVVSSQAASAGSNQRLYPGSLGKIDDSPTTTTILSPAANNAKIEASQANSHSNIITNGFTWEKDTNNLEPVSHEISSPGAHMAELRNGAGSASSIYGQTAEGNMGYLAPGGSTASVNSSLSGSTTIGSQYPQSQSPTATQNYNQGGNAISGTTTVTGFNLHNIGLPDPVISSDGAIVVNASTREIYYAKNHAKAYAPAGLTVLLTGYLLLQYRQLNDVLAVSASAVTGLESGANNVGLKAGDTITVQDALYALYIKSACDVANVIAENVAGSQQAFVNMMNQTAAGWGTIGTHFANCNGLNNASQVSTVYDMAIIMSNIVQNPTMNQIMQTTSYTLPVTAHRGALAIKSKNEFITPGKSNYYQGVICGRMGYTSKAKYTMASLMIHNNQYLIAVVMYSNNTQYVDSKRLFNFGRTVVDRLGLTQAATFTGAATQAAQTAQAAMQAGLEYAAQSLAPQNVHTVQSLTSGGAQGDTQGVWQEDNKGWFFMKANGSRATNEWIQTDGKKYCVDSDGYMITGWREFSNGNIYYFNPTNGELRFNTWVNTSTGAYYLQEDGSLARASKGQTKTISTQVGNYIIDENGKALQKVNA